MKKRQVGCGFDIQKLLGKTGIEMHWPRLSTWDLKPDWKNDWRVGVQASIAWTGLPSNTTSITVDLRIHRTSEKLMPK